MDRKTFNAGKMIFREGDVTDCAYLVVVGSVEVSLHDGRRKRIGQTEIFGEMGLIDGQARSATVRALQYTVCANYSKNELLEAIRTQPEEAVTFIRALIARLREANESR